MAADLHASQPGRGIHYTNFRNSYQIMICNYNVFDWDNDLVEEFTYRNEHGRQLSDITTAIFIDLTETKKIVKKPVAEMTAIEQWVVFFTKANDPRYRDTIDKILKRKGGISVAYEMLTSISTDENERARFRSRRKWQMDRDHELAVINSKWEGVVADKDAKIAEKDELLADKDKSLADKDAEIARLLAMLGEPKE
jgi:hypothetical protein